MCERARVCAPRRPVALWCGCHRRDIFEINCSLEVAPGGRDVTSLFAARLYCSFHVLTMVEHISQVLNTLTVVSKYTQTKSRRDDFVATSDETSDRLMLSGEGVLKLHSVIDSTLDTRDAASGTLLDWKTTLFRYLL